jgi:hypothetical protein
VSKAGKPFQPGALFVSKAGKPFLPVAMFVSKAGKPFQPVVCKLGRSLPEWSITLGLTHIHYIRLEIPSRDKHSSLF